MQYTKFQYMNQGYTKVQCFNIRNSSTQIRRIRKSSASIYQIPVQKSDEFQYTKVQYFSIPNSSVYESPLSRMPVHIISYNAFSKASENCWMFSIIEFRDVSRKFSINHPNHPNPQKYCIWYETRPLGSIRCSQPSNSELD